MTPLLRSLASAALLTLSPLAMAEPTIRIDTSLGPIVVELDEAKAPETVANFLRYVEQDYYEGTIFHRVIPGFMIQGGGFDAAYSRRPTGDALRNEANNGLKNVRGSIAMARTRDPHSATAQFFINHADNPYLDHTSETTRGWGYAVFGQVTEGMDVVDAIAAIPTGADGPFRSDVPTQTVLIRGIERVEKPAADAGAAPAAQAAAASDAAPDEAREGPGSSD